MCLCVVEKILADTCPHFLYSKASSKGSSSLLRTHFLLIPFVTPQWNDNEFFSFFFYFILFSILFSISRYISFIQSHSQLCTTMCWMLSSIQWQKVHFQMVMNFPVHTKLFPLKWTNKIIIHFIHFVFIWECVCVGYGSYSIH